MLLGIALSALGNGLVLPYTFIYFHNIRDFPIAVAGLIASYGAFSSLAISPLVGNLIDIAHKCKLDFFYINELVLNLKTHKLISEERK